MGGPHPENSPERQGPRFCPTRWSLAGSPSLQQGYGVCRVSGEVAMARVGVAVPGMGCGGQGDSQTFVWQMRAGCPFL